MIRLLAISASPVEGSSTDLLLNRLATAVTDNLAGKHRISTDFVKLNELRFAPCQSCGEAPTPKFCFLEDDLTDIYARLVACDCVLFGSPVYFDTVSAQAKMFIDRCNCFRPPDFNNVDPQHDFIRILDRSRPGAMVLVGGRRGWFEGARRVVAGFFKWVEVDNQGVLTYSSPRFTRSGSAADCPDTLKRADEIGRLLAEAIVKKHE
ncbi:MAG: flavodoxin family protein [bacterium]